MSNTDAGFSVPRTASWCPQRRLPMPGRVAHESLPCEEKFESLDCLALERIASRGTGVGEEAQGAIRPHPSHRPLPQPRLRKGEAAVGPLNCLRRLAGSPPCNRQHFFPGGQWASLPCTGGSPLLPLLPRGLQGTRASAGSSQGGWMRKGVPSDQACNLGSCRLLCAARSSDTPFLDSAPPEARLRPPPPSN